MVAQFVVLSVSILLSASTASGQQHGGPVAPYGICAHLPRHDAEFRDRECAAIAALGASTVRFGVSWRGMQKSPDAPLDFSKLDAIVAEAEAHGLTILPILYWPPKWTQPIYEHLDEYAAFIEAVVEHYGGHFPAIELWNEPNLKGFWGEEPDPAKYALVLKAGYEAAKRAGSPSVFSGGTAGVPLDYIRKVYEAGGGPFFDALAIHPYGYPYAPEGDLDKKLDDLRALMAEFDNADKPIDDGTQARYLTRAMAIAFAKGVERYFWYEFQAPEVDPYYSEDHFGMTHADMSPKPAFDAYRAFVAKRPAGSVQRSVPLRDPATGVWRSEWTRPDGTVAGVFWKPGEIEDPVFYEGEPPVR